MSELAHVTRSAPCGMITLRGDLGAAKVKKAVKAATGQAVPAPGKIAGAADGGVAWMSPDEALLMVPYGTVAEVLARLSADLAGTHHMAVDVSDARALFRIDGPDAREVLARLCPVDLHSQSFGPGDFRRTRMAQIAAAFWMDGAGFSVVCFRSVSDYAEALLSNAAKGAKTGAFD